jgi:hypothetical protein
VDTFTAERYSPHWINWVDTLLGTIMWTEVEAASLSSLTALRTIVSLAGMAEPVRRYCYCAMACQVPCC